METQWAAFLSGSGGRGGKKTKYLFHALVWSF